jgi:hypothetical protein
MTSSFEIRSADYISVNTGIADCTLAARLQRKLTVCFNTSGRDPFKDPQVRASLAPARLVTLNSQGTLISHQIPIWPAGP